MVTPLAWLVSAPLFVSEAILTIRLGRLMGFLSEYAVLLYHLELIRDHHTIAHGRYINFFGQREARLSADQSVFDGKDKKERRTWLIKSASYFLLFAPQAHLKGTAQFFSDACKDIDSNA